MNTAFMEEGWLFGDNYNDDMNGRMKSVTFPHIETASASHVQTLVCIKETGFRSGTYTDGEPAYTPVWDVRLLQWPDGKVIGARQFTGEVAQSKGYNGPGYGNPPTYPLYHWLVTAIGDNTVLYDLERNYLAQLDRLAFSPTRQFLAVLSGWDSIVWDEGTGQKLHTLSGTRGAILGDIAFSSDGTTLASSGCSTIAEETRDCSIWLWNAETGQRLHSLRMGRVNTGAFFKPFDLDFSPDGGLLVSGSGQTVMLWDTATGQLLHTLGDLEDPVQTVVFSPDGKLVASGSSGVIKLWDVETGLVIRDFQGHNATQRNLAFSPDGKLLAAGVRGEVVLHNVDAGSTVRTLDAQTSSVRCVVFSSDGRLAASGSGGTTVLWAPDTFDKVSVHHGLPEGTGHIAFSPNGDVLAIAETTSVVVLDAATGDILSTYSGHTNRVDDLAFSPDGQRLASLADDRTVKLWDLSAED